MLKLTRLVNNIPFKTRLIILGLIFVVVGSLLIING